MNERYEGVNMKRNRLKRFNGRKQGKGEEISRYTVERRDMSLSYQDK